MTQKVKIFVAIFHTFTRGTTDLCLPFVENVKKSKNLPTLLTNPVLRIRDPVLFTPWIIFFRIRDLHPGLIILLAFMFHPSFYVGSRMKK
jgi:hypothetical protein